MFQFRSTDGFRTFRVFCQRAIALAVLASGCVCEDSLTSYSDSSAPSSPPASSTSTSTSSTPTSSSTSSSYVWSGSITTPPTRIEVVPGNVGTMLGHTFEMRARLFDSRDNMMPVLDAGDVEWSITPNVNVSLTAMTPGRVAVAVLAPGVAQYTLTAHHAIYGLSNVATISPVTLGNPSTSDWIASTHTDRAPPMVALVDGTWTIFENDKLFGFSGGASLGAVGSGCSVLDPTNCGKTTIFATERALHRGQFSWSASCDLVDRRDAAVGVGCSTVQSGRLDQPVLIPLQVWSFATTATDALVTADLGFAKNALRDSWGGVSIAETIHQTGESRMITMEFDPVDGVTCAAAVFTKLKDEFMVTGMAANAATLVLVDQLMKRKTDGTSEPAGWAGYACPYSAEFGAVAIIDWPRKHITTVSHETGHVLGPWDATDMWGHMDGVAGAHSSNLMFSTEDAVDFPRWMLTLGQSFRYSLDQNAIARRGGPAGFDRCAPTAPSGAKCPSIIRDVP